MRRQFTAVRCRAPGCRSSATVTGTSLNSSTSLLSAVRGAHTSLPSVAAPNAAALHGMPGLSHGQQQQRRRRHVWAVLVGCCVGAALCAAAGATTAVLCRPYDTPPYLIPYYLRDVHSRFQHYASVRKRKGGPVYMTAEDFVLALLASPERVLRNPDTVKELHRLFEAMDANGDCYISFPEFRFLMSLLTSDPREVAALFHIVDMDESGTLSLEEFANVLRGATKDEAVVRSLLKPSTRRNGVVRALFGDEDAPRRCSFEELEAVILSIRTEVWKAEFRQFDTEERDCITADAFAALIARQVLGSHLPYYLVGNIRRLHGSDSMVTLDMWLGFNEVMLRADELAANVEMFSSSGMSVTKRDFRRLMAMAGAPALPQATIDVVFAVFDKNGDGSMEMDEFLFVMRKKIRYHFSVPVHQRKSLPRRFLDCSSAALDELGA